MLIIYKEKEIVSCYNKFESVKISYPMATVVIGNGKIDLIDLKEEKVVCIRAGGQILWHLVEHDFTMDEK